MAEEQRALHEYRSQADHAQRVDALARARDHEEIARLQEQLRQAQEIRDQRDRAETEAGAAYAALHAQREAEQRAERAEALLAKAHGVDLDDGCVAIRHPEGWIIWSKGMALTPTGSTLGAALAALAAREQRGEEPSCSR